MTKQNPFLNEAAKSAGISIEQAKTFLASLYNPTAGMCDEGREGFHSLGPFSDPAKFANGLTGGEWDYTKAAQTWRYMISELLLNEGDISWRDDPWEIAEFTCAHLATKAKRETPDA